MFGGADFNKTWQAVNWTRLMPGGAVTINIWWFNLRQSSFEVPPTKYIVMCSIYCES